METPTKTKPKKSWALSVALAIGIMIVFLCLILSGSGSFTQGKKSEAATVMQALTAACEGYMTDNGPFPRDLDNHMFWSDLSGADSGKVYMSFKTSQQNDKGEIIDPWGTPYRIWYMSDKEVGMTSAGPDKTFGTPDDITNQ